MSNRMALITLDQPRRHNALVPKLLESVLEQLESAATESPNGLLLESTGSSFSTGGDLRGFWRHRDRIRDYADRLVGLLNEVILKMTQFPAPVACAVQGQVTGGSLGFLLAADYVVMHPCVTVRPWYATVGFAPDGGWNALMPGRIGAATTREWLQRDDPRDAERCLAMGLADAVDAKPGDAARHWLQSSPSISRSGKKNLQRALLQEKQAFVSRIGDPSALDGIHSFLEGKLS